LAPDPGLVRVAGSVTFANSATFTATLNGTDPGSYSQLSASGPIDLGGSTLNLSLGFDPQVGDAFTLLTSDDPAGVTGTFAGVNEGAVFTQGGFVLRITYHGGVSGNSVVLTRVA
jgi:hypothetical protein